MPISKRKRKTNENRTINEFKYIDTHICVRVCVRDDHVRVQRIHLIKPKWQMSNVCVFMIFVAHVNDGWMDDCNIYDEM